MNLYQFGLQEAENQPWFGTYLSGNPAARRMLGLEDEAEDFLLKDVPALEPVAQAYAGWRAAPSEEAAFVTIKPWPEPGQGSGDSVPGRPDHQCRGVAVGRLRAHVGMPPSAR